MHIYTKNENTCSEENTKDVAKKSLDKETMDVAHGFNQSSQQKPGIETDLCQQIHCWFELKKTNKVGWDEGGLLNFLDFTELGHSNYLDATMHYFSRKGKNGSEGNSEIVRAATPPYT